MLEPETSNNAAANEGWRAAQAQQAAAQAQDAARSKGAELYTQVPRLAQPFGCPCEAVRCAEL
jgi:hypothetical protein